VEKQRVVLTQKNIQTIGKTLLKKFLVKNMAANKNNNINEIITICDKILKYREPMPFDCLALSSALYIELLNNNIQSNFVAGSLKFNNHFLFQYYEKLPEPDTKSVIYHSWGGHCWIEVYSYLLDLSILRTIRTFPSYHPILQFINKELNKEQEFLFIQKNKTFPFGYFSNENPNKKQIEAFYNGYKHTNC
jgi:hypothetical protein